MPSNNQKPHNREDTMQLSRRGALGVMAAAGAGLAMPALAQGLDRIGFGLSPSAGSAAPIIWGQRHGLFAKEGIEIDTRVHLDSGPMVPELLNGQLQFGSTSLGPMISSVDAGIPIRMVSTSIAQLAGNDRFAAVIVPASFEGKDLSGVTTWAAGGPQRDPLDKRLVKHLGGDYDAMTILATPLGSTVDVIATGSAGAARLFEPFLSRALANDRVKLLTYIAGDLITPGVPNSPVMATESYLSQNPDLAQRFVRALNACFAYAAAHRAEIGAFVAETGMGGGALKEHQLPGYVGGLDRAGLQLALDLYNDGFTRNRLTADQIIWPDAPNITG